MALLREEEEEMMPHKRKRKTKEEKVKETESGDKSRSQSDYGETKECIEEKPEKPAKLRRPHAPPSIDFSELLKIAEKKQFEPIKIAPKLKEEDEDERPMTKKQRVEYMKEKEWRLRKEGKLPPLTALKQLPGQDQGNNRSRTLQERSRDQKSNHPAADSNSDRRFNCPSADKNRDQRNGQLSVDGQREQMGSRTSMYGTKDQTSGRFSDQRIGHPSGDMSRDQRNGRPLDGSRNLKNDRSSGDGNWSIPRIPKVNSIRKGEKSQHRIPECSDINRSNNRSVKLQGNSDGKVCKERNRDVSGKLPVKSSHTSSASASGHGSVNRNSVEQRKYASSSNNNNSTSKNYNLSAYSKKLQESLLAKLQEKEKSGELSEAKKLCVPGAQNSKLPKNCDSGSFDLNRGPKPQSKVARNSDSKDAVRGSSLGKHSIKPFTSSQRINKTLPGVLSSKSQDSPARSKSGHQIPSRDAKDRKMSQVTSSDVKHRQFPLADVKPQQVPPDSKPQQFAPPDVKSRQFPLQGVKPRQFPPADVRIKPKPPPKCEYTMLIDSEVFLIKCFDCISKKTMSEMRE
jgi:protein SPT2